ncbi:YkuS family protein [Bacillus sp. 179-C3.3 HS]|uniref:YkuS family protein n=1 Tax=Bacillus sp. 179-C3.3 HS TaxID=3232162 RepID=UPI0039A32A64
MTRIGVESSLTDVEEQLKQKGYDVVRIQNEQQMDQCDCYVVTGLDSDALGISNTETKASVIKASGRTADEICQEVEQRIH